MSTSLSWMRCENVSNLTVDTMQTTSNCCVSAAAAIAAQQQPSCENVLCAVCSIHGINFPFYVEIQEFAVISIYSKIDV